MHSLPFAQPGSFYRGNLHAHSDVSDGALSPERLVQEYRRNRYDFIAVTDHFRERFGYPVTDTRHFRDEHFTTILGAELHPPALQNGEDWHILAVGLPADFPAASPDEDGPALARRARDAGAYVALAHPHWYSMTIEDGRSVDAAHAVEIFNLTCAMANDRGYGWYLADLLLGEGQRLHAIATDDTHGKPARPDLFGGWVMVKSESLDPDALLSAIKSGHFYSSQGPQFHDIAVSPDRDKVQIACSPVTSVQVCGRAQRTRDLHGLEITRAEIPLDRVQGGHFRVTIIDRLGRRAWSNPIWID